MLILSWIRDLVTAFEQHLCTHEYMLIIPVGRGLRCLKCGHTTPGWKPLTCPRPSVPSVTLTTENLSTRTWPEK